MNNVAHASAAWHTFLQHMSQRHLVSSDSCERCEQALSWIYALRTCHTGILEVVCEQMTAIGLKMTVGRSLGTLAAIDDKCSGSLERFRHQSPRSGVRTAKESNRCKHPPPSTEGTVQNAVWVDVRAVAEDRPLFC
jgi:hypothetical protein